MTDAYRTLLQPGEDRLTVQKSVFIGRAAPAATEEEALRFLREVREREPGARHHCYAYIIGLNEGIMRYSDDGEPGGTAGLPIISLLRSEKLVNCCAVVTRYFGGILLGTGGLVRAYTQGCRIAVEAAGKVVMERTCRDLCEVPYACWDRVRYVLENLPARFAEVAYSSAVSFTLLTRRADRDRVLDALMNASGRQMISVADEERYEAWEID